MDVDERERMLLAPYAMRSCDSAGRVHDEPPHPYRGPYQRDRDRIFHSSAFRRLAHKTQVFTGELGDYHRSRLTHTLEVASIARTLARALRLNEDLVEALALIHDIGHPPFGHAGEEVLDECLRDRGGFNHNAQALRIVERLETRYPEFPGLNLSREVLDGQRRRATQGDRQQSPLLEVQIVDAADSIAYDAHDADDALELNLVTADDLQEADLWREAAERVAKRHGLLAGEPARRAVVHELIDWQVNDVFEQTQFRLHEAGVTSRAAVLHSPRLAVPSAEMDARKKELEALLFKRVYRHPIVLEHRAQATQALRDMFARYLKVPDRLPRKFAELATEDSLPRAIGDYLAGMTDRFALDALRR
ncbi:MAG: dNTP triphosphohydrolase [Pirellulales bacterium]